jgi:hypothetical protein
MSNLLNTIPGDIPGLLRRGSPVRTLRHPDAGSVVITLTEPIARVGFPWSINDEDVDAVWSDRMVLDLDDDTARWHAARWIQQQHNIHYFGIGPDWLNTVSGWYEALHLARTGADMTPKQIDTLARIVLRLAGRAS